ncbi:hypothetical protein OIU77_027080 [Salix suchowensis]|uniref:Uncharacterized protein n=1 Tax=Salix suchowensis TaxID=1278906 RepID=A0ABQ9BR38_9ROSI|nr:hypothetical protein OIU77_027080 [Salix suchowensis]
MRFLLNELQSKKDNDSDSSSFTSIDNEETSEACKLHQNGNCDPGISDQMKSGKAENGRRRRKSKRDDSAPNEIKKGPRQGDPRKKSKTITDEHAWMREEMQKSVAEETVPELEKRSFRVEKGYGQLQAHNEFEENVDGRNLISFENNEVHHQETIFLQNRNAFRSFKGAKDCNDKSTERSENGRKTSDSNNHHQVPEHQSDCSPVIGYLKSAERDKGERVSFSVEPMFPANLNQAPSSMYSTLPTVLTKPHVANHRFDTSPLNSIQPIIVGNQIGINSERPNLLLGSSSHHGYFQDMQPEERSRNFARVSSRDTSYFNQNNMSSIVGNGLPVPFFQAVNSNFNIPAQFSLENLARESNNKKGEATRLPGESYSFSEQFIVNNFLNHSSDQVDGGLLAYQDGYHFPK